MAGADLHMAMGILSSAALAEQGRLLRIDPLLQELRSAIRDVSALEETPAGMIRLAGDRRLAPAGARLRYILEAALAGQLRSEAWHQVSAIFSLKNPLFRLKIVRELRSLLTEFTEIASSAATPGHDSERRAAIQSSPNDEQPPVILQQSSRNPTRVEVNKSSLGKLKLVKQMVRILLVDRIDDDGPLFLPLAGGPATGKTLVARTLFNDARVMEKFVVRVWVHVSQGFEISKILWEILNVAHDLGFIYDDQANLKSHVWEALSNRRYLIVLDDAWSENVPEWYTLMEALPPNGTLILTSRIPAVVSCVATIKPHPLKTMKKKLQFKFVHLWEAIRRKFEDVLMSELTQGEHNNTLVFQKRDRGGGSYPTGLHTVVLQRAHASYFHLPLDLRKCLLYCSVFPLAHEFDPEELADLLVAEGRISPTMTQAQRICFLQKLFDECFHPVEESENTTGKCTYWMHSIIHMFAKIVDGKPNNRGTNGFYYGFQSKHQTVLSLQASDISSYSRTFERMTNLRYVNLSRTDIERIPTVVLKLQFLQTLILSHCEKLQILHDTTNMPVQLQKLDLEGCCYLVELPPSMSKMKSLQFLNVHECSSLIGMPYGMDQLMNLETILGYIVPNRDGKAISELQPLANLKILSLKSLENISNIADARDVKLQEKQELESLAFQWNKSAHFSNSSVSEVLECLRPNQHLKTLEIVGYEGNDLPSWMKSSDPYLTSLVVIRLVSLKNCETLPPLGLLPLLKIVEISGAETICSISDSFYGSSGTFPTLEKLTLSYMSNLEIWEQPQRGAVFPCLAEVTIIQCPKLAFRVELPSVTKLTLWMNNNLLYSSKGAFGNMAQNLKHVSISLCQELIASSDCEGLQDLCRLRRLELCGCDEMMYMPHGLQHLSSLRSLTIVRCNKLETLPDWLGNLSSLHLLRLDACPMLHSIPEVLKQRRSTRISIIACPKLPEQLLETGWARYDDECGRELFEDIISDEFGVEESTVEESFTENIDDTKFAMPIALSTDFGVSEAATCEVASDLYSIVMNTPGFTDEQLFCALSHLLDNEAIGKTFMDLPELRRISWIAKFLAKHFQH